MADDEDGQDVVEYSLTYALDRRRLLRRACPSCGREFKTQASPSDLAHTLQPVFQELGLEIGGSAPETSETGMDPSLYCPYCGHCAPASETFPDAFWAYAKRWIYREFVVPQWRQMTSDWERSFRSSGRRSSGLLSVEVSLEAGDLSMPVRPIAGPESSDMKLVQLLCCHREIGVLDRWPDSIFCPYCGLRAVLQ